MSTAESIAIRWEHHNGNSSKDNDDVQWANGEEDRWIVMTVRLT